MSGSIASASANPASRVRRELVISVNWIGDAIMAMPALQIYRRLHPDIHLTVLARGVIAEVWSLHRAPDNVIRYSGHPGLRDPLFEQLRQQFFDRVWILPNSFRSAWISFRSGIPVRTGYAGGIRSCLLNDPVLNRPPSHHVHQAWEYLNLMAPDMPLETLPKPELAIPDEICQAVRERFGAWSKPMIGMIPGAARGPSKRWPASHFTAAAKHFVHNGFNIALFGGPDDRELCHEIAADVGDEGVLNVAGKTNLMEWGALLESCSLVIANDSGGMHLAAALGRPVIALYGLTDPTKTGPLGDNCHVMQNSSKRTRDIARNSAEARASLAAIRPESVIEAAHTMLHSLNRSPQEMFSLEHE